MKCKRHILPAWAVLPVIFLVLAACSSSPKPAKTTPTPVPPPVPSVEVGQPEAAKPDAAIEPVRPAGEADQEVRAQAVKGEAEEKDAATLLEDAFAAYEEAQAALGREDMEGALTKLDEAYGYLLRMSVPADSPLLQEKRDLRLLI